MEDFREAYFLKCDVTEINISMYSYTYKCMLMLEKLT